MKIVSVNVGQPQALMVKDGVVLSSIVKRSVEGPVMVRRTNLEGDAQADLAVHGGERKAVYAYSSEYYPLWKQELGDIELPFGSFGENLTTEGMFDQDVYLGDHYQVGSAVLTVTQPRTPCFKLNARFVRDDMGQRMIATRRYGFYLSVAQEGLVQAGDEIRLLERERLPVSVAQMMDLYLGRSDDPALIERAMSLETLGPKWRNKLIQRAGA